MKRLRRRVRPVQSQAAPAAPPLSPRRAGGGLARRMLGQLVHRRLLAWVESPVGQLVVVTTVAVVLAAVLVGTIVGTAIANARQGER